MKNVVKNICLSFILLSIGCAGAPKFPVTRIWETAFDPEKKEWVCGEYQITNVQKRQYKHVQDHPLQKCVGVFGFSTRDIPKILDWADDMEDYTQRKCK